LDYLFRPDDLPEPPDLDVPEEREPPPEDLYELPELLFELDLEYDPDRDELFDLPDDERAELLLTFPYVPPR
jgi:hypothetical protein